MRDKFRESGQLIEFIDFNENRIFSNAEIQTMIFLAINQPPETNYVRYLKSWIADPPIRIIKTLNDTRHNRRRH